MKKLNNIYTVFLLLFPVIVSLLFFIIGNIKGGCIFYGIFNIGMYLHLTVTKLCNVFMAQDFSAPADTFWKTILLFLGAIGFAIGVSL